MGAYEKSIGTIANIVSIITFVLSVINWFGFEIGLDSTIPNRRVGYALLIIFSMLASLSQARAMVSTQLSSSGKLLLWFGFSFAYVFAFLFLLTKTNPSLQPNDEQYGNIIISAVGCNVLIMLFFYVFPRIYPDGFTFLRYFTRPLVSLKYGAMLFGHYFILLYLFGALA